MSARKKFWVDTNRHTGRFTTLFGPYYSADHDDNRHSVTGSIYAKGIWQALYNEAYRHAQSQGYSTDSISVSFDYPVMWEIICPATNATASRGVVEPCGHKSLIETKMYGPEFLAQMPITLHWVERSWESTQVVVGASAIIAVLTAVLWFVWRYYNKPIRPARPR